MATPPRGATPMKVRLVASRAQPLREAQACVQQLLHFSTQLASGLAVDSPQAMAKMMDQYCKFLMDLDRKADSMRSIRVPVDAIRHLDTSNLGLEAWRQDLVKRLQRLHEDAQHRSGPLEAASLRLQQAGWEAVSGGLPSSQPPPTEAPPRQPHMDAPDTGARHMASHIPVAVTSTAALASQPLCKDAPSEPLVRLSEPCVETPDASSEMALSTHAADTGPHAAEAPSRQPHTEAPDRGETGINGQMAVPIPAAASSSDVPALQPTLMEANSRQPATEVLDTGTSSQMASPVTAVAGSATAASTPPRTEAPSGHPQTEAPEQDTSQMVLPTPAAPAFLPAAATSSVAPEPSPIEVPLRQPHPEAPAVGSSDPISVAATSSTAPIVPQRTIRRVKSLQIRMSSTSQSDTARDQSRGIAVAITGQPKPVEQLPPVPQAQQSSSGQPAPAHGHRLEVNQLQPAGSISASAAAPVQLQLTLTGGGAGAEDGDGHPDQQHLHEPGWGQEQLQGQWPQRVLAVPAVPAIVPPATVAAAVVGMDAEAGQAVPQPATAQGRGHSSTEQGQDEGVAMSVAAGREQGGMVSAAETQTLQPGRAQRHLQQPVAEAATPALRGRGGRGRRGAARMQAGHEDKQNVQSQQTSGNVPRVVTAPPPLPGHTRTLRSHTRAQAQAAAAAVEGTGRPSPPPPSILPQPPSRCRGRGRSRGSATPARPEVEEAPERQIRHPPAATGVADVEEGTRKRLRVKL